MKHRLTLGLLLVAACVYGQDKHHPGVDERGDHVMGFSHEKTTHHFRLFSDGGALEVTANDPEDDESLSQIRMHLSHIAGMFAQGNFKAPMLIHDRIPPGVPVLEKLKADVNYRFEEIKGGGRVRIATKNKDALEAIHEFLRFQISDHQTGDSPKITVEPAAK